MSGSTQDYFNFGTGDNVCSGVPFKNKADFFAMSIIFAKLLNLQQCWLSAPGLGYSAKLYLLISYETVSRCLFASYFLSLSYKGHIRTIGHYDIWKFIITATVKSVALKHDTELPCIVLKVIF